jgi:hypothetical protein
MVNMMIARYQRMFVDFDLAAAAFIEVSST